MAAFKQFTTKDVTITPFHTTRGFSFTGNAITASNVGIDIHTGRDIEYDDPANNELGFLVTRSLNSVFNSVKQLYYTNYSSSQMGDSVPTRSLIPGATEEDTDYTGITSAPRFENYLQTDLTQSRYFPTQTTESNEFVGVFSIPAKLYGENIVPNSFELIYTGSGYALGTNKYYRIIDDGEGNLLANEFSPSTSASAYGTSSYGTSSYGDESSESEFAGNVVGQIFYAHGTAVLTSGSSRLITYDIARAGSPSLNKLKISFSSSYTINEHQYRCTFRENEFLFSTNPTLLSSSEDYSYKNFVTGSDFSPYITAVGLYNENQELVAVGKLSLPIPKSKTTDTTIVVNIDM